MTPEQVPHDLAQQAESAWSISGHVFPDRVVRAILAAVLPEHEKRVRAQLVKEIEEYAGSGPDDIWTPPFWSGLQAAVRIAREDAR